MMEISEPSILAKLPQPQAESGRILYAQVYNLSNGLKRKRQELCAAIDGDSINTYEVRQGRILNSCPIPPDDVVSCPPCSLCWKNDTGTKIRSTYYVTNKRNETYLSLYQEEPDGRNQKRLSKSVLVNNGSAPVIQVEVLPGSNTHTVLLLRENGQYEVFKPDLSAQVRRGTLQGSTENLRLVAAQPLSSTQASKSVLKARPDLTVASDNDSSFMLGVSSVPNGQTSGGPQSIEIDVWRFQSSIPDTLSESRLTPILQRTVTISTPLLPRDKDPIVFASKDTRLIVKTQSKMYVFDLTPTTPRKIHEAPQATADQRSSIFISDNLMAFSTSSTVQLQNSQFKTLLHKLDLNRTGTKRKRSNVPGGSVSLIAYFPVLKRILATKRDQLIAIDLHMNTREFSSAIKQVGLLINNLGRGATSQDVSRSSDRAGESFISRSVSSEDQLEQWRNVVKDLDFMVQEKNYTKFEEIALESLAPKARKSSNESQTTKNHKIDYMISKILGYEATTEEHSKAATRNVRLAVPALKLLETLAVRGYLSVERINKVFKTTVKLNFEPIKHGVIPQILAENDESLSLLFKYLDGAAHIAHQELCAIVQLLLRRALVDSDSSNMLTITDVQPDFPTGDDISDTAPKLTGSKGTISANISTCLCAAVERLADTSPKVLSSFMQNSFSQGEIIALVQFARQQLFRSGYTRSLQIQLHPSSSTPEKSLSVRHEVLSDQSPEVSLGAIASILSSCMDAIGPMGVLSFGDEEDFVQTLIPDLSSEIARATEAIQDAAFLEGLLRENLRYVESTARNQAQNALAENGLNNEQPKPGAILTLYSEPTVEGRFAQIDGALPLGLRNEGKINGKARKGKAKRTKRSEREMGMQQDRLRGSYALERLAL